MLRIDILSAVPELFGNFLTQSILGRAQRKGLVHIQVHNLRDYSTDPHRRVDDYPYGGEPGMVMQIGPILSAIQHLQQQLQAEADAAYDEIIYTAPDGQPFNQPLANQLSLCNNLLILCGHYKGIDQRIRQHLITREISVGDYVLSGGELPAAIIADAVTRLLPGAIGDSQSALNDSFQNNLLSPPIYTRPAQHPLLGDVPPILLSGNHKEIAQWQQQQALLRTQQRRPELLNEQ